MPIAKPVLAQNQQLAQWQEVLVFFQALKKHTTECKGAEKNKMKQNQVKQNKTERK